MSKILLFAKSHVEGYTRKDGTFVAAHEDTRQAKPKKSMVEKTREAQAAMRAKMADGEAKKQADHDAKPTRKFKVSHQFSHKDGYHDHEVEARTPREAREKARAQMSDEDRRNLLHTDVEGSHEFEREDR